MAESSEACPSESDLLEYADRLLPEARAAAIGHHLETCDGCRRLLAQVAQGSVSIPALSKTSIGADDATPQTLLRQALERDDPAREISATRGVTAITLVCGVASLAFHRGDSLTIPVVLLAFAGTSGAIHVALLRGWFHPAVPYVDLILEVSMFVPLVLLIETGGHAISALAAPAWIPWGCVIVFSAMRAKPIASIAIGALAAAEAAAVQGSLLGSGFQPTAFEFGTGGLLLRCLFLFVAAVMGGWISQQFVRQADAALRTVREQDLMSKYVLQERLGAGGMAEVFRATYCPEGGFRKPVAVKRVVAKFATDTAFLEALREEARLGASLAHPNVVQILDCGRFRDTFIVAMELVEGITLAELLRLSGPLPSSAVAFVGSELAAALEYIHTRKAPDGTPLGLVHRDLNPPNVLLSAGGEVKLRDFGVAAASTRQVIRNESGWFYGKASYASPEQQRGEPVRAPSDVFSLGVTLREAGGGASIARALGAIIDSLMASRPEDRPDGAEARRRLLSLGLHAAGADELPLLIAAALERKDRAPVSTSRVTVARPGARRPMAE